MAHKETFHLPSVMLEVDFAGDVAALTDLKGLRVRLKERLMKRLIADGVAFQERAEPAGWKGGEDAVSRLEGVVDAWIVENDYRCSKLRDRHSRKARWELDCGEPVMILMMPNEGGPG